MDGRLRNLAACLPLALLWSSCVSSAPPASRPRMESCRVAVAQGAVRFTIAYLHTRPLPERLLIVAFIRSPRGDDILRVDLRPGDRTIAAGGTGAEALGAEGYLDTRSAGGGTLEFTLPERVPGVYDLSGVEARAHLVIQAERGEGAVPLGELDTGKQVF